MIIVDSHCHLDMLSERGQDIDDIISRAKLQNVRYLQTICTKLDDFDKIVAITMKYRNIFASVGVHPSEVDDQTATSDFIQNLINLSTHKNIIGLGETGLDYFYNTTSEHHKMQQESFACHINAAQDTQLPVIIHTRNASKDTIDIVAAHKHIRDFPSLIHCFTESKDFVKKALDLDMYISIAGIVTFKNAQEIRDAIQYIPLDKLLVETDAPYLAPVPHRGKINEPSYITNTISAIAELKSVSYGKLVEYTTDNFFRLFSKAHQGRCE